MSVQGGSGVDRGAERDASSQRLEGLLDRIDAAVETKEEITIGHMLEAVGDRSYGPLLLLPGLVILAPVIGDIPGVPVLMGAVVILTAGQLPLRRDHVWLPGWLLERSVSRGKMQTAMRWLRPAARFLDRWSRPRLPALVRGGGTYAASLVCIAVAAATPLMEVVPFSANLAGIAIATFGLALTMEDGLVALFAFAFSLGAFGFLMHAFVLG